MSELPDEAWESDDCVRRTVVLPAVLTERLAARAEQRGLSFSDLLVEYAQDGLDRDEALALPGDRGPVHEPFDHPDPGCGHDADADNGVAPMPASPVRELITGVRNGPL